MEISQISNIEQEVTVKRLREAVGVALFRSMSLRELPWRVSVFAHGRFYGVCVIESKNLNR